MAVTIATPRTTTCRREKSAISFVIEFVTSEEPRLLDWPDWDTITCLATITARLFVAVKLDFECKQIGVKAASSIVHVTSMDRGRVCHHPKFSSF